MNGPRHRWAILAVGVVAFMQTHLHRLAFAPLIPAFVTDLGLSYAAAGTVQTAYFWTYAIVQIPIGVVADRWGVRRLMLCSMALLATGALAFGHTASLGQALAARMLVGLGAAAVWVPALRLVGETFPAGERARATGIVSAGGGLGGTLGLVVVPWLATAWGWRRAYDLTAIPAALTFVMIALALRPRPAAAAAVTRGGLREVLARPALWRLNVALLLSYGGYFSFVTFLPAFLVRTLALTVTQAGAITGLVTAGTTVSWVLAGFVSDRLARRKMIFIASQAAGALASVVYALAIPGRGAGLAAVAAASAGLLMGGLILPFVMVVESFPRERAATATGVLNTACFVGAIALPPVLGRLVDVSGSFTAAFLLAALCQAAAVVPALGIPETGRRATAR